MPRVALRDSFSRAGLGRQGPGDVPSMASSPHSGCRAPQFGPEVVHVPDEMRNDPRSSARPGKGRFAIFFRRTSPKG
jgi:hypothetical protein